MPYRKEPLIAGQIFHVFNRSVAKQPIFLTKKHYQRTLEAIAFYRFDDLPFKFSRLKQLPIEERRYYLEKLSKAGKELVQILAFCIMPNHVHFLLEGLEDSSISKFMRDFQHSYSKYFNVRSERVGTLFQPMFKAVRVETDEQLLHVSRYIHLNPVSSFILDLKALENYPWSSFSSYVDNKGFQEFVKTEKILKFFKSKDDYRKFVFDQVDYLGELHKIKHLALD